MDDLARVVEELTFRVEALEEEREDDAGDRKADASDAEGRGLFSRWRRRGPQGEEKSDG